MSAGLTRQQSSLLRFLQTYIDAHGFSPSFDQMRVAVGLASKSGVSRLVEALEERGYIKRAAHRARAIELVDMNGLAKYSSMDLRRELARRAGVQPS